MADSHYNDEAELTRYIWSNYAQFLTEAERRTNTAFLAEEKAMHSDLPRPANLMAEWARRTAGSNFESDFALGPDRFRRRAALRFVQECGDEVVINRCPQCTRIVRTPQAQQCLWCGRDWHKPTT